MYGTRESTYDKGIYNSPNSIATNRCSSTLPPAYSSGNNNGDMNGKNSLIAVPSSASQPSTRPHTISTSYERARPSLSTQTFEPIYGEQNHLRSDSPGRKLNGCSLPLPLVPPPCTSSSTATITLMSSTQPPNGDRLHRLPPQPPQRKVSLHSNESNSNHFSGGNQSEGSITPTNDRLTDDLKTPTQEQKPFPNSQQTNLIYSTRDSVYSTHLNQINPDHGKDGKIYSTSHNSEVIYGNNTKTQNEKLIVSNGSDSVYGSYVTNVTTTTSCDNNNSPAFNNATMASSANLINRQLSTSCRSLASITSKGAPPPPPVRRTSSISNPNAITVGTLRNAGLNSYQQVTALQCNQTDSSNAIYGNCSTINVASTSHAGSLPPPPSTLEHGSGDSLNDSANGHTKLIEGRKEFIQTLNAKLSAAHGLRASPKAPKRRSLSVGPEMHLPNARMSAFNDLNMTSQTENTSTAGSPSSFSKNISNALSNSYARSSASAHGTPEAQRRQFHINGFSSNTNVNSLNQQVAKAAACVAYNRRKQSPSCVANSSFTSLSTGHSNIVNTSNSNNCNNLSATITTSNGSSTMSGHSRSVDYGNVATSSLARPVALQRRSSQPVMGIKSATCKQQSQSNGSNSVYGYTNGGSTSAGFGDSTTKEHIYDHTNNQAMYHSSVEIPDRNGIYEARSVSICNSSTYGNSKKSCKTKEIVCVSSQSTTACGSFTELGSGHGNDSGNIQLLVYTSNQNGFSSHSWSTSSNGYHRQHQVNGSVDDSGRESLMDQIRKGTKLRKVKSRNDRSAPKIT